MSEILWSDWLDFSLTETTKIPTESGVYMMHASMKILFIGGSDNLSKAITDALNDPCTKDAKRFKYASVKNYQEKHQGSLPKCMT